MQSVGCAPPIKTPHVLTIVITDPTNRPTLHPGWSGVWRRDGGQDLSCHSPHSYLFNFSCEQASASTSDRERPPRRACPQVCAVIRICTIHHRRDYKEVQKKAARQLRLPPLPPSLPPSPPPMSVTIRKNYEHLDVVGRHN